MGITAKRADVLAFRVRAQQLDRDVSTHAADPGDAAVLDLGVQDTGPDGALWALTVRGLDVKASDVADSLATAWTIRGAPHVYRRADLPSVAAAVQPYSDADAAKRIFDAAKPLKAAGIPTLKALDTVAAAMRSIVTRPKVKGEVSGALTAALDEPYLRYCRPCEATHVYEQPFRLAALRAGLELQPGTSPPVLQRIPRFKRAAAPDPRHDVVRGYLWLLGPATAKDAAAYLDAPVKEVKERWPADAVPVTVDGEERWLLEADADALTAGPVQVTRLLGPYDLYLQAKDRPLLVPDSAHAKALWPVLGRPGAVLVDGELAGTWRPRKAGKKLSLQVEPWKRLTAKHRTAVGTEAERLAGFRGVELARVEYPD